MLMDCDCNKGLLITQKGYSQAALDRAYYDPMDLELDILNFEELHEFQNYGGMPYAGKHGVMLKAPFGWVIDATRREGTLTTFYQRGLRLEDAIEKNEWIYVNIMARDEKLKTIDDFLKFQNSYTLEDHPDTVIKILTSRKHEKYETRLRAMDIPTYPTTEYTLIIDFPEFFFFAVLFSAANVAKRNLRKLEDIIHSAIPMAVIQKT